MTFWIPLNQVSGYFRIEPNFYADVQTATLNYIAKAPRTQAGREVSLYVPVYTPSNGADSSHYALMSNSGRYTTPLDATILTDTEATLHLVTGAGEEDWQILFKKKPRLTDAVAFGSDGSQATWSKKITLFNQEVEATVNGTSIKLYVKPSHTDVTKVLIDGEEALPSDNTSYSGYFYREIPLTAARSTITVKALNPHTDNTYTDDYTIDVFCKRTDAVTDLKTDPEVVELEVGEETKTVSAIPTPAQYTDTKLTWSVADPTIASVTWDPEDSMKATVTGLADGVTKLIYTDGFLTCESVLIVNKTKVVVPLYDSFGFYSSGSETALYPSEIDEETRTATYTIPDTANYIYPRVNVPADRLITDIHYTYNNELITDPESPATLDLTAKAVNAWAYTTGLVNKESLVPVTGKFVIASGAKSEEWTVILRRSASLKALTITDPSGKPYDLGTVSAAKTEYQMNCLKSDGELLIDPTATAAKYAVIKVNGLEKMSDGLFHVPVGTEDFDVTIDLSYEGAVGSTYTVHVSVIDPPVVTFETDPEDVNVYLQDSNKNYCLVKDGKASLLPGTYTWVASAPGYVSKTGTVTVAVETDQTVLIELEEAEETERGEFEVEWGNFRGNADNTGVTSAATPTNKAAIETVWGRQVGSGYGGGMHISQYICVGNYLYASKQNYILQIDKDTGLLVKAVNTRSLISDGYMPLTYGGGYIFSGGATVQCFKADTLEQVWSYNNAQYGQASMRMNMRYEDGYLYGMSFHVSTGSNQCNIFCIQTDDEDPTKTNEAKLPVWSFNTGDYGAYWAGIWTNDKYVYANSGTSAETPAYLWVLDKKTGELKQKIALPGSCRCSVAHYNGRLYFGTLNGYLCSYTIGADGLIDLAASPEPLFLGGRTTSSPAIYNNRMYIGMAGGSVGSFSDAGIYVIDINPTTGELTPAYVVPTSGNPQSSGCISTAYVEETGYVYVYFSDNSGRGQVYVVKDKPGLTQKEPESGIFWTAPRMAACINSIIADNEGRLYYGNDTSFVWCIKQVDLSLNNITAEGGNAVLDEGAPFDKEKTDHTITVDAGTKTVTLTFNVSKGAKVWIGDKSGKTQDVTLVKGKADVTVDIVSGESKLTYTIAIRAGTVTGDTDYDGKVDIFDAARLIDMVRGRIDKEMEFDFDKDDDITIFDVASVIDMVTGRG